MTRRARRTRGTRKPALSRRRFLSLIAAGSAAAAIAPAEQVLAATAAAGKPVTLPAPIPPSPKVRAEIEKQKKSTAAQLKVIRDYVLPAGSPMAFEFRPLRRGRK